jgi:hypothetical protein
MLSSVMAVPLHYQLKAFSNPAAPSVDGNTLADTGTEGSMNKTRLWTTIILALAILGGGVIYIFRLFRLTLPPFERHNFPWLMSLMASLSWWAVAATRASPNYGSVLSICTWISLYAIYVAKHYRGLRNGERFVFTSLLGGLIATSVTAAIAMLAWKDPSRDLPASMEDFVRQALIVGPTVTTAWTWIACFTLREIEQQPGADPGNDMLPSDQVGTELARFQLADDVVDHE